MLATSKGSFRRKAIIPSFDEDGNYVEAWADNPPTKKRWTSSSSSKPKPEPKPEPKPAPVVTSRPRPTIVSTPKPVAKPTPKPRPVVQPKPVSKPKPKPKPKPAPVKVVPKFKSHTVGKGDTLYSLGRKYGVTVRSIQQANGISGTNIGIGKTLKIPVK